MLNSQRDVCAVIVSFQPDLFNLSNLIKALASQVNKIILVDNGSDVDILRWKQHEFLQELKLELIVLGENLGVGAAQNVGINKAKNYNGKYVILFDQDSEPASNMIMTLFIAAQKKMEEGVRVAAVGACYCDQNTTKKSGFVRVSWCGFSRIDCDESDCAVVETDFLISSGTLILLSVISDVGMMDESLFIDHIDTEWCFRAKSKGYRLFGSCDAFMTHSLGDSRTRIWFLRWRTVPHHSPFRYYYIFRNSLILQSRSYIPIQWKIADVGRCIRSIIFYGLFSANRLACLSMMYKGIKDGMQGINGKLSD